VGGGDASSASGGGDAGGGVGGASCGGQGAERGDGGREVDAVGRIIWATPRQAPPRPPGYGQKRGDRECQALGISGSLGPILKMKGNRDASSTPGL
jgi:hypothetical protein